MRTFEIKRIGPTDSATYGVIYDEGRAFAFTLEDPWQNNESNVSCIPPGTYVCKRVVTPKHGECFEVTNVPGRSAILFHAGNTTADTEGCILLGFQLDFEPSEPRILSSRKALSAFMQRLNEVNEFRLAIKEV